MCPRRASLSSRQNKRGRGKGRFSARCRRSDACKDKNQEELAGELELAWCGVPNLITRDIKIDKSYFFFGDNSCFTWNISPVPFLVCLAYTVCS